MKALIFSLSLVLAGVPLAAHSETQQGFGHGYGSSKSAAERKAKAGASSEARKALRYLRLESERNEHHKVKFRKPKVRLEDCETDGEKWSCTASWTFWYKWVRRNQ